MIQPNFFHACGALMAVGTAWLTWCSHWIDPTAKAHQVHLLLTVLFLMALVYAAAAYGTVHHRLRPTVKAVLFWAVLFRLILLPSQPVLETDWNRYLWDGYITSQGINPYQYPPALFLDTQALKELPEEERRKLYALLDPVRRDTHAFHTLQTINNPSVHTIYPPFTQLMFLLATLLQPFSIFVWRCVIVLFDGVLIASILYLLKRWKKNPAAVLFYAWSPVVLKEYINTTHFDVIALSLFFLGVALWEQKKPLLSSILWSASVLSKFFTLPLLFFWLKARHKKPWTVMLLSLLGISLPFVPWTPSGFSGYAHFSQRWESNSSLVSLLEWGYEQLGIPAWNSGAVIATFADVPFTLDAFLLAKLTGLVLITLGFGFLLAQSHRNPDESNERQLNYAFYIVGGILICSPVANPWYIAWVTPFLCFFPFFSWLYLSVSCLLYYLFFIQANFTYPPWIREIIYIPFYLLLLSEVLAFWRKESGHSNEKAIT